MDLNLRDSHLSKPDRLQLPRYSQNLRRKPGQLSEEHHSVHYDKSSGVDQGQ